MLVKHKTGHAALRYNVKQFMVKSNHPQVARFRAQYEETDGIINGETWAQYWAKMIKDRTWVDYWFVQATAWYLQLDIWIIATSSTESSPYIAISGNLEDGNIPTDSPVITLGTKSNCHYQSLLPIEMFHLEFRINQHQPEHGRQMFNDASVPDNITYSKEATKKNEDHGSIPLQDTKSKTKCNMPNKESSKGSNHSLKEANKELDDDYLPFMYTFNGRELIFPRMTSDYTMMCPNCLKETKYMVQHISRNSNCQKTVDLNGFKEQFKAFKDTFTRDLQRQRYEKCLAQQRSTDERKVKEGQNKRKKENREQQRAKDEKKIKEAKNKQEKESVARQRAEDEKKVKEAQNKRKKESMARQRAEDEAKFKESQNRRKKESMAQQRAKDEAKFKQTHNKRQKESVSRQRAQDETQVKAQQAKSSRLSLGKRKAYDHIQLKEDQNRWQAKHRRVLNETDRLREFKEATKYNAIFICICCHQRMF